MVPPVSLSMHVHMYMSPLALPSSLSWPHPACPQVYGFGKSEEFLGEFMKASGTSPIIATKYAPQPWRLTQGSVPAACKASLERLQLQQMGLYIQHWPGFFFNAFSNDGYLQGLADCVDQVRYPGGALVLVLV